MSSSLPNYDDRVQAAVVEYWNVRRAQAERSRDLGVVNTGLRAEVTGGQHMNALELLLVPVLVDAGMPAKMLQIKKRPVPGYFRRDKALCLHDRPIATCTIVRARFRGMSAVLGRVEESGASLLGPVSSLE